MSCLVLFFFVLIIFSLFFISGFLLSPFCHPHSMFLFCTHTHCVMHQLCTIYHNYTIYVIQLLLLLFLNAHTQFGQRRYKYDDRSLRLTSIVFYLWMIIFTVQAHKEERFLFPIYPLICLLAAISLIQIKSFLLGKWLTIAFSSIFIVLSLSRILAIYTGKLFII